MEQHHVKMAVFKANAAFYADEVARGAEVRIYTDAEHALVIVMQSYDNYRQQNKGPVDPFDHLDPSLDHLLEDEK